ncbi:glycosyltransferase family 4 protein [Arthrobacter bambusae]|uniref:glycosyltransferase family 4 protein n=1 Tax=Arthrobacter bambusae TaxID=1338426 RepID=UPI00278541E3|nr:glycosyltransferase family 4 protein [Arthrobacter bambusae]MDQ0240167.1 glycosyltransferase involved in cell wall biosynthesis [Arthrobacter bambusae]
MTRSTLRITIIGLNYVPEPTGNAPYTASLAEGLAAKGHVVNVITGYPHYPEWKPKDGYTGWTRREILDGVKVKRLRHHIPRSPNTAQRMHMELSFGLRLMCSRWGHPDVVLVVSPALFSSGLGILRARLSPNRPAIGIWVQDIYSRGVVETGVGGRRLGELMGRIEAWILRSADGVVAIHERFQKYIVGSLGVPSTSTRVIRNWTHLPFAQVARDDEMRAKLGWTADDIIVLHAGNMGQKQGLENVVATARLAAERHSKVRFVLMGDGNQRKSLEEEAQGVQKVDFIDPLPGNEFQQALAAADVLLVNERPGVKDMAVPSKLTSYFSAGVPVVAATDEGSVTASEIETSGGGIRVDAGDPEALLDALEHLSSDPNRSRQLARNGLEFRQVTLSKTNAIAHYDEFLSSLASARGR